MYVSGLGRVGGEWGEWIRGLGLSNTVKTGGVLDVYLCLGCGGVCGEWVADICQVLEG